MGILERFKLDGRVALVTAGSGPQFGSSLTEGLAEAGATVISASRSLERNEEFAAGLRERDLDVRASVVVPDQGHMVHVKAPVECAAAIRNFLAGLAGTTP